MSFCPYFKNGYFGSCTASASNHIPTIAEMEAYCFGQSRSCSFFMDATSNKGRTSALDAKSKYDQLVEPGPDSLIE